jgi:hypothetical protein
MTRLQVSNRYYCVIVFRIQSAIWYTVVSNNKIRKKQILNTVIYNYNNLHPRGFNYTNPGDP